MIQNRFSVLHSDHTVKGSLTDFVFDRFGAFGEFLEDVVLHSLIDTLKPMLFLFLTYLLMEFIEHKASERVKGVMSSAGRFGPILGGLFGAVPQCGFSAAASNLYTGRVITLGTLIAVFLSTSDEMLPILIAGNIRISKVLLIILYKCAVGIAVGFAIDLALYLMKVKKEEIDIDSICENDECHCERGIIHSAIHHTVSVSVFILLVTVLLNTLDFFIGEDALSGSVFSLPFVSHLICSVVGLIPNCASSVALTRLAMSGVISSGAMMSGLFAGAGVGLLILFKVNKRIKENMIIVLILVFVGVIFGLLADLIGLSLL